MWCGYQGVLLFFIILKVGYVATGRVVVGAEPPLFMVRNRKTDQVVVAGVDDMTVK
jgi:hypothetical protein